MPIDESLLRDLRADYDSGNLIIFVGAGVSAGAGLPTWHKLAETLRDLVRALGRPAEELDEISQLIAKGELVDALTAVKGALGPQRFNREVEKALDDTGHPIPPAAEAIAALPKLRAVITTNLDRLLERAFKGEWRNVEIAEGDLAQQRRYIYKMHGTLGASRTWVFSRDQYDKAVFTSPQLQTTFRSLYQACHILFVGCGLADDNLDQTFAHVRAISGEQPPRHYALISKSIGPSRRKQLEAAGIQILLYPNAKGDHSDIVTILRGLDPAAALPAVAAPAVSGAAPSPALTAGTSTPVAHFTASPAPARPAAAATGAVRMFFCYAPPDRDLFMKLRSHLAVPIRQGLIEPLHSEAQSGALVEQEIRDNIDAAAIILLLVTSNFLASDEVDRMVEQAMSRWDPKRANVVAILLKSCDWQTTKFGGLQPLPKIADPDRKSLNSDDDLRFVDQWGDEEKAFTHIAKELRARAEALRGVTSKPRR